MNINPILEQSRRVEEARAALKTEEEKLAALVGGGRPAGPANKQRRPIRGAAGPSVSQRVLNMVIDSGRAGVARRDLVAVLGKTHEAAIASALKAHQGAGRIQNDAGQWVATAAYVRELQSIPGMSAQADTRPLRPVADVGAP